MLSGDKQIVSILESFGFVFRFTVHWIFLEHIVEIIFAAFTKN